MWKKRLPGYIPCFQNIPSAGEGKSGKHYAAACDKSAGYRIEIALSEFESKLLSHNNQGERKKWQNTILRL